MKIFIFIISVLVGKYILTHPYFRLSDISLYTTNPLSLIYNILENKLFHISDIARTVTYSHAILSNFTQHLECLKFSHNFLCIKGTSHQCADLVGVVKCKDILRTKNNFCAALSTNELALCEKTCGVCKSETRKDLKYQCIFVCRILSS